MKPLVTLSASMLFGSVLVVDAATLVGPITNPANQHWYYLLSEDTWQNSETQAIDLGGHLVTIHDQAEQEWVFSTFGSYGGIQRGLWIGLREVGFEGNFEWSSGESVVYGNWLPGQPDNSPVSGGESYVHMLNTGNEYGHPGGVWNDLASPNAAFPTFEPICGVVEVVPPKAPVLSIRRSPLEICWDSSVNWLYQLEYCPDLNANRWTATGTPKVGTGGRICVADVVAQGQAQGLYRVVVLP